MSPPDPRTLEALDCVRRVLALIVGELVRLSRGDRIDSAVLLDIVQDLKLTAQLLENLKRSDLR